LSESGDTVGAIAVRLRELTQENERLFRDLVSAERRFRSLSRSAWRVQEEERRRLARELHDGIGQTLTALKNQLEGARLNGRTPEAIDESIAAALEMTAQALHDTRELSRLLRPAVLDDLGLSAALRWLTRTAGARLGVEVALTLDGVDDRFDREIETLAFRIVQEALTNVAKHSGATKAEVTVSRSAGRLAILVADDGRGFDARRAEEAAEAGVGLRGMRDRAELFGGRLRIDSGAGEGTRVDVLVPLPPADEGATS
jgi:two-component system sensor histidine kinase UhpB